MRFISWLCPGPELVSCLVLALDYSPFGSLLDVKEYETLQQSLGSSPALELGFRTRVKPGLRQIWRQVFLS